MLASEIIAREMQLPEKHVAACLGLLSEGSTIPFISRYRKEATGGLDEVEIFAIQQRFEALQEFFHRKEYIIQTIESQGRLTPEIKERIDAATEFAVLEDIYLPFKPRRRTRAQIARENGLEPLARMIMAQNCQDVEAAARRFVNENVADTEKAVAGASDIIAEWVSEDETARERVRNTFRRHGRVASRVIKGKEEEAGNFQNYFKVDEPLQRCQSHRYLAMRRGEAEGFLRVGIDIDDDRMLARLRERFVRRNATAASAAIVEEAVRDGYRRLMRPSIESQIAQEAKEKADDAAIRAFADNVHQLLLAAPLGARRTIGIDPGYRTGCKVVVLDANGNLVAHDVIYPTPPRNYTVDAERRLLRYAAEYDVEAVAIGNGTASRETERFVRSIRFPHKVEIFVVSENGASVYSASKVAREEFPDEDVTVRGAVSIARRLMDPLAELVKIDPKAIGVGQYQHDVDQSKLKRSLDATVEACVNQVGVNINTASRQLLSYVSGIGDALAANIVAYRAENGDFRSRREIMRVPRLGAKAFEQAAGFLRVPGSDNVLDNTGVHPERYELVKRMASDAGCPLEELVRNHEALAAIDLNKYVEGDLGLPTLTDIVAELEKPGRDPREKAGEFAFDENVSDISDLAEGMVLPGIVNNITDFGAFVDIGVHESGLIHISQIAARRVSHPSDVLKLHQQVKVRVISVDLQRKRIGLSLRDVGQ
ncbi:MAG TPA: RNA-binding transcriptional accessory protein [Porphyromonadaceae bacterium]|nr:RNA-binding transcriptional accessory protein [Porphyromonadaceae bacterium]